MLAYTALLSLAALVAADQTFTLTAKGDKIDSPVAIDGSRLVLGGTPATFLLQEPSGYMTTNGKNVVWSESGLGVSDTSRSKDFGTQDGKLRFGPVGSFTPYLCADGSIDNYRCPGYTAIELYINGAPAETTSTTSSTEPPKTTTSEETKTTSSEETKTTSSEEPKTTSSEEPKSSTSETPAPENTTKTETHSTLLTVTSCSDHECTSAPTVTPHEAGAAQAGFAAGALAVAGALLL